jgi:hypothetical protein
MITRTLVTRFIYKGSYNNFSTKIMLFYSKKERNVTTSYNNCIYTREHDGDYYT